MNKKMDTGYIRSSHSVQKRTVDDISVTSDPSDVGHTSETISRVDIKDIFDGQSRTKEISTSGVYEPLGFAG